MARWNHKLLDLADSLDDEAWDSYQPLAEEYEWIELDDPEDLEKKMDWDSGEPEDDDL
jgi:hypothetical protein